MRWDEFVEANNGQMKEAQSFNGQFMVNSAAAAAHMAAMMPHHHHMAHSQAPPPNHQAAYATYQPMMIHGGHYKKKSCFNCGSTSHIAIECKEATIENMNHPGNKF